MLDRPARPAQEGLNISTPVLVNDLDLRVYGPGGTPVFTLHTGSPESGNNAVTGDNIVDNVEQVYIDAAGAGDYTVEVSTREHSPAAIKFMLCCQRPGA